MTGKTLGQYRQLFQHLKQRVRRTTGHHLRPRRFVLDFEVAAMLAIETELPNARISGCYFHFTQSLWRNLQVKGLTREYKFNRKLKKTVRLIMAMGFLPVLLVRNNFQLLKVKRRTRHLITRYPAFGEWLDYVERAYINNNAQFPPVVWNVFERTSILEQTTTWKVFMCLK
jgi:MULE transposase domain